MKAAHHLPCCPSQSPPAPPSHSTCVEAAFKAEAQVSSRQTRDGLITPAPGEDKHGYGRPAPLINTVFQIII